MGELLVGAGEGTWVNALVSRRWRLACSGRTCMAGGGAAADQSGRAGG